MTIRLYNPEEVEAIVEAAVAERVAVNIKATMALKRERRRLHKKYRMKQFLVLGFPVWCCFAMVVYWLTFGY